MLSNNIIVVGLKGRNSSKEMIEEFVENEYGRIATRLRGEFVEFGNYFKVS